MDRRELPEGEHQYAPIREPRSSSWWKPALIGFALGVGASQTLGIWTFASHLVHGVPISGFNGAATIAKAFDPDGWQRVAANWDGSRPDATSRFCVSLTLPERGLEARQAACDVGTAKLRVRSGQSPKGPRLALSRPLFATTTKKLPKPPVAGWAAQIGAQDQSKPVREADATPASSATPSREAWATSTLTNSN